MDLNPAIESAYRLGRGDFSSLPQSASRQEVSKEFLSIFLDEILKETFSAEGEWAGSSRMGIMREIVKDKLSEDIVENDTFSLREVFKNGQR